MARISRREPGSGLELRNHLVERYLNGCMYFHWMEHELTEEQGQQVVEEIERIEDQLRSLGVTDKEIEKLVYYARYFYDLKDINLIKIDDASLKYVVNNVFK